MAVHGMTRLSHVGRGCHSVPVNSKTNARGRNLSHQSLGHSIFRRLFSNIVTGNPRISAGL